ncbi:MAG: zinc-dependent alcohol dehydrogenase family protein [Gammaproteobacteria bacterium]|nr:zinc-dependent alcohol dehydrogenase family protein [Gammaproteobacteria bacterium]
MKAMVLERPCDLKENERPLTQTTLPEPQPGETEILVKVSACGVCHTELDEIEGRTLPPNLPVVPGHQAVGRVEQTGSRAHAFNIGDRVGIGWIYSACGKCKFCLNGNENLCGEFRATGRDANGGYAQYMAVPESFAYRIPEVFSDAEAAPLLCAGAIGYRSVRLANLKDGQSLGLTGFGASAHLVLQMAKCRFPNTEVFVFARSEKERVFAKDLGAVWAGDTAEKSPVKLDCIIDTTPVWKPIVEGLKNLEAGGRLVINAIGKEDIDKDSLMRLNYPEHLWMEKEIKSVANVSRRDVSEFLELAAEIPLKPEVREFALEEANQALLELKNQKIRGAKVLRI